MSADRSSRIRRHSVLAALATVLTIVVLDLLKMSTREFWQADLESFLIAVMSPIRWAWIAAVVLAAWLSLQGLAQRTGLIERRYGMAVIILVLTQFIALLSPVSLNLFEGIGATILYEYPSDTGLTYFMFHSLRFMVGPVAYGLLNLKQSEIAASRGQLGPSKTSS